MQNKISIEATKKKTKTKFIHLSMCMNEAGFTSLDSRPGLPKVQPTQLVFAARDWC